MKGLIYKEFRLFIKSFDKRVLLIAFAMLALVLLKTGRYSGIIATVFLSMGVGLQSTVGFANDEKARWMKYERALPIKRYRVVASKYLSLLLCLVFSIVGAILFNLVSGVLYGGVTGVFYLISIGIAILVPLIFGGLCLPISYWFSAQSTKLVGYLGIIPGVYIIQYLEDGTKAMPASGRLSTYFIYGIIGTFVLYGLSYAISVVGDMRKECQ